MRLTGDVHCDVDDVSWKHNFDSRPEQLVEATRGCDKVIVFAIQDSGTEASAESAMFGTPDPVPNVLVYVANGPIQPFPPGVQCSQCGSNVSGNPLVQTTTASINGCPLRTPRRPKRSEPGRP